MTMTTSITKLSANDLMMTANQSNKAPSFHDFGDTMKISTSYTTRLPGPLPKEANQLLDLIQEHPVESRQLRERLFLIRSKFYKLIFDLRDMGVVSIIHNNNNVAA
ncbi:MAG: hypothetical protein AAGL08_13830 [Cyanobacteria bacterium J06573_11]